MHLAYITLGLLLCAGNIETKANLHYVIENTEATLSCSFSNSKTITWRHEGNIYSIGNNVNTELKDWTRYTVIGDFRTGEYNLKISNFSREDEGVYWCIASNGTIIVDLKIEIKVMVPPSSLEILNQQNGIVYATRGESVNLTCTVKSGIPLETLFWYKKGRVVLNGSGSLMYNFTASLSDHLQIFVCKARHMALRRDLESSVQIILSMRPVVKVVSEPPLIYFGKNVSLACQVDNPLDLVNVEWKKSNEMLHFRSLKILLVNISRQDFGIYSFTVENRFGRSSNSFILEINDTNSTEVPYWTTLNGTLWEIPSNKGAKFDRHVLIYVLLALLSSIVLIAGTTCIVKAINTRKHNSHISNDVSIQMNNIERTSQDDDASYEEISVGNPEALENPQSQRSSSIEAETSSDTHSSSSVIIRPTLDNENYLNPYNYLDRNEIENPYTPTCIIGELTHETQIKVQEVNTAPNQV